MISWFNLLMDQRCSKTVGNICRIECRLTNIDAVHSEWAAAMDLRMAHVRFLQSCCFDCSQTCSISNLLDLSALIVIMQSLCFASNVLNSLIMLRTSSFVYDKRVLG